MTNRQIDKFILVGLGNPGEQYQNTRHNAGKMFVRWLHKQQATSNKQQHEFEAIESKSFMNESGGWIKKNLSTFNVQRSTFFIVHDDLDIPLGGFKIQFGKGPKQHNGVLSIEQAFGTNEFWRVRIGVENRLTGQQVNRLTGEDYVLARFTKEERRILEEEVFPAIQEELERITK